MLKINIEWLYSASLLFGFLGRENKTDVLVRSSHFKRGSAGYTEVQLIHFIGC